MPEKRIEPCWTCGSPISFFVDEDGTPHDITPLIDEERLARAIDYGLNKTGYGNRKRFAAAIAKAYREDAG